MVPSSACAGVDIAIAIGLLRRRSAAVSIMESPMNRVVVLPMQDAVLLSLPPPTAWPMLTVDPIASPTIMTVIMCMTWDPMETAVVLATPSYWPIMKRSAIP